MEVLCERVPGLDIGEATLTVCVHTLGPRGRRNETRTFPTTTRALIVMHEWLLKYGVTVAAMESSPTCWKPRLLLPGGGAEGSAVQRRGH